MLKGVLSIMKYKLHTKAFRTVRIATKAVAVSISTLGLVACSTSYNEHVIRNKIYFSHAYMNTAPSRLESAPAERSSEIFNVKGYSEKLVIYFANDSAKIHSDDLERLQSFVLAFPADAPPLFLITGNTDSNHSDQYNQLLSERRAISTQSALLHMGVAMKSTAIQALGESQPADTNATDEGRQGNRRVTVYALPQGR